MNKQAPAQKEIRSDFLVIGCGIMGLAVARELRKIYPQKSIVCVEKEEAPAFHASGRNSGVLHAGFYYTADSLKAKFTASGNRELKKFCLEKNIPLWETKKVVVAQQESEIQGVEELYRRGIRNQVEVQLVDEKELKEIDPNAKTIHRALYSPQTATVDPSAVCAALKTELESSGVQFFFSCALEKVISANCIQAGGRIFSYDVLVNCAGLYADLVARQFGFSRNYTILPFKGLYLKYTASDKPIRTNIYPVPNLKNPFLGVHFTLAANGQIKIGPTAIPAFWRENYGGFSRFRMGEFCSILSKEAELYISNAFQFRSLSHEEMKKYRRSYFVGLAKKLVYQIDERGFTEWSKPGIRAQLLNIHTNELVQDFVVEGDGNSVHVLNAVSPAFTGSFPFAAWIVENHISKHAVDTE